MFLGPGWSLSRSLECSLIAGDFMEGGDSAQAVCVSTRLVVPVTVLQQRIQFRSVNEKVRNTVIRHYLTGNRRKLVTVTPTGGFVLRWPPSHREARTVAIILWFYCSFPKRLLPHRFCIHYCRLRGKSQQRKRASRVPLESRNCRLHDKSSFHRIIVVQARMQ